MPVRIVCCSMPSRERDAASYDDGNFRNDTRAPLRSLPGNDTLACIADSRIPLYENPGP